MQKQQVIDQIKKLLALTSSNNPHESKLAYEKAQKLIYRCNIESDALIDKSETAIINQIAVVPPVSSVAWKYIPPLIATTSLIFGCYCRYTPARVYEYNIFGFPINVEIAIYTIDLVFNQGIASYRAGLKQTRSLSFGDGFWAGFTESFVLAHSKTKAEQQEALVLYDLVKEKCMEGCKVNYGGPSGPMQDHDGYDTGSLAGKDVQLYKAVTVDRKRELA